jgi:hypothetical protein
MASASRRKARHQMRSRNFNPIWIAIRGDRAEFEAYIAKIEADAERRAALPKLRRGVIYLPDRSKG